MQNMSEHVYYSVRPRISYRLPDSTHITQTTAGNTLVTEQPQHSSMFASSRIKQISANGLIYNDLHGNQYNNFHIPNFLDFLWNSNIRKRPFPIGQPYKRHRRPPDSIDVNSTRPVPVFLAAIADSNRHGWLGRVQKYEEKSERQNFAPTFSKSRHKKLK